MQPYRSAVSAAAPAATAAPSASANLQIARRCVAQLHQHRHGRCVPSAPQQHIRASASTQADTSAAAELLSSAIGRASPCVSQGTSTLRFHAASLMSLRARSELTPSAGSTLRDRSSLSVPAARIAAFLASTVQVRRTAIAARSSSRASAAHVQLTPPCRFRTSRRVFRAARSPPSIPTL